jgi:hypothetical protein
MERRSFLGALTAASLGVVARGLSQLNLRERKTPRKLLASLSGQASKMSEFPPELNIILVHAAWADGSCWRNVILPLDGAVFGSSARRSRSRP